MAKTSITSVKIDNTDYNLMIINDLNVIPQFAVSGYFTYQAPYYEEWNCTHNTDFAPVKSDTSSSTCYNTDLKFARFFRYVSGSYHGIGWSNDEKTNYYGGDLIQYNGSGTQVYYSFIIDDETEEAWIINHEYQNNTYVQRGISYSKDGSLYEAITKVIPPEPQGDATVKINYYLPNVDYAYAKITYKQDEMPENVDDGKSVTILKDETTIDIAGLFEHRRYWFKIFTDKSESEAVDFLVNEYIPPEPEDPDIMLLRNGQIKREDALVSTPYINAEYYNTAVSELRPNGYYLEVSDSNDVVHKFSSVTKFYTYFTQSQGTSGYKPLIYTLSQESKTADRAYNFVKIKCDVDITMAAGSDFSINPSFYVEPENSSVGRASSYVRVARYITDKTHIDNNRIVADPNSSFNIKESIEFEMVYSDYKVETYQPCLYFNIGCQGINPFTFKALVKEIKVEMHKTICPRPTDEFYIAAATTSTGYKWNISEIYQFITSLGYNAFVLEPKNSTYDSTKYWVIPLNIDVPENMYVCKDYGITRADNYFAIGYETTDTLTSLPTYCSTSEKTLQLTNTKVSFTFSTTRDGHQYRYRRISYAANRMSFVFYTEGYKHLYVNNVLLK